MILLALALAFLFQYGIAPSIDSENSDIITTFPGGERLYDAWNSGCMDFDGDEDFERICRQNSGVYRVGFCAVLFFLFSSIASYMSSVATARFWGVKYVVFLLACWGVMYIDNDPFFNDVFMNIARIGAVLFILLQQIILIDMAYNWNDYWVVMSNVKEREEGEGAGNKYLCALLSASAFMYIGVMVFIGIMFHYFSSCPSNTAFISITIIGIVGITILQLSGEEGSLLTSAVISSYCVYLVFTSLTKSPDEECNPHIGENNAVGITFGVGFTVVSMAWIGYSLTAEERLTSKGVATTDALLSNKDDKENYHSHDSNQNVGGIVLNADDKDDASDTEQQIQETEENFAAHTILNLTLLLLSCYFTASLTSWGTIETMGNAANPDTGKVAMWMIITSQWIVILLYSWTLMAPRLFPDRDFS